MLFRSHGNEGGLLDDARNDKDKITRASVASRLKELQPDGQKPKQPQGELWKPAAAESDIGEADSDEAERKVLMEYLEIDEALSDVAKQAKADEESLMKRVLQKYQTLSPDEIKALVVDHKWLATLEAAVQGELDRVSQTLTSRIRQLADRYASPLPDLTEEVNRLSARVGTHLAKMGMSWT